MKKILITGKNSYVGNSFEKWLMSYSEKYMVDKISLRDGTWENQSFSNYDVVLHVAGIAHIKETKENEYLYYQVNRDLAYRVAQKAKKNGVRYFVFLSSMSVYGMNTGVIDHKTIPRPQSNYGKSKLEAEKLIESLSDEAFKVAILRPPMIYGKECKGNYSKLAYLAVKSPIFPAIENRRSMIYIDNLSKLMKNLIDNNVGGLFCPQNKDYINTSDMVRQIAIVNGKKIKLTKVFNPILKKLNFTIINKVFGDLIYKQEISEYREDYNVVGFKESINLTERYENPNI